MDVYTEEGTAVIHIEHDLDGRSFHEFQDSFDHLNSNPVQRVVLDLTVPRYLHSTSIAALIWAYKRCKKIGISLSLVVSSADIRRTLKSAKVCSLIPVHGSIEAATA